MNGIESETSLYDKAALIISDYAGIEKEKIRNFIVTMGLNAILENPSLICITEEQQERMRELKVLMEGGGDEHETV